MINVFDLIKIIINFFLIKKPTLVSAFDYFSTFLIKFQFVSNDEERFWTLFEVYYSF